MINNKKIFSDNYKISTSSLLVSYMILIAALFVLDYIPLRFRIIIFLISVSISMFILLVTKKNIWRYTLAISLVIISIAMYASKSMLDGISEASNAEFVEYIYIENLNNEIYEPKNTIGFYGIKWNTARKAFENENLKYLNNTIDVYNDPNILAYDLINNHIDGALIQSSFISDILLVDNNFWDKFEIVDRFKIEQVTEVVQKPVNINKEPFVVYLSGVDVYGDVLTRARTDMNILLAIDPVSMKVLSISIPRDSYVPLSCEDGAMDKLTHSSLYGIQCSINTLEALFGIPINYYARINFSGLVELVDYIGGVDVNSQYQFSTDSGFYFKEGMNHVDGKKALAFARERDHIEYGDVSRGVNHQELIQAIINKLTSPSMITKLPQVTMLLQNILDTNLESKAISTFISQKIDGQSTWDLTNYNLDGKGDMQHVHSLSSQYKYYVFWPSYDSLKEIKQALANLLGGNNG